MNQQETEQNNKNPIEEFANLHENDVKKTIQGNNEKRSGEYDFGIALILGGIINIILTRYLK